jgi:hypothetical protein
MRDFRFSRRWEYKDDNSLRYSAVERDRRFRGAYIPGDGPDDKYSTHFWNVGLLLRNYMALYPRRLSSSYCYQIDTEISNLNQISKYTYYQN